MLFIYHCQRKGGLVKFAFVVQKPEGNPGTPDTGNKEGNIKKPCYSGYIIKKKKKANR